MFSVDIEKSVIKYLLQYVPSNTTNIKILKMILCKKVVILMKSQGYEIDYSGINSTYNLLSDESD